jgi:hypothetical protein
LPSIANVANDRPDRVVGHNDFPDLRPVRRADTHPPACSPPLRGEQVSVPLPCPRIRLSRYPPWCLLSGLRAGLCEIRPFFAFSRLQKSVSISIPARTPPIAPGRQNCGHTSASAPSPSPEKGRAAAQEACFPAPYTHDALFRWPPAPPPIEPGQPKRGGSLSWLSLRSHEPVGPSESTLGRRVPAGLHRFCCGDRYSLDRVV